MDMSRVFAKENVYKFITFGMVSMSVVIKTVFLKSDLSGIALVIAFPTFIISIVKLLKETIEDIINRMNVYIDGERYAENPRINWSAYSILKNQYKELSIIIEEYRKDNDLDEYKEDEIIQYHRVKEYRDKLRKARMIILIFYYALVLLILVLVYLSSEPQLPIITDITNWMGLNTLSVWTLLVMLIDIILKEVVEEVFVSIIKKIKLISVMF